MSYEMQDRVWEIDLSSSAKLVLLALAYRADASGSCYPSAPGIARLTGLNVKTVRTMLKELEKMGLLTIENRAGVTPIFTVNPTQKRVDPKTGIPKNNPTQIRVEGLPKNGQGVYPNLGTEQVNNKSITSQSNQENISQESQSIKSNTPQSMKANTLQSMRSNTRTNKEQIKEQIINLNTGDISSCFGRFGQNPVSAPTSWEPDEEDVYDIPLRQQLAMSRKIEVDVNDTNHIPTASEIVVLAATLGYRLTHNAALDEIASRKSLTTGMLKEAIQRTKDNTGGIGYLVRILQNASKDPDAFNGIRRAPVVTAETITEAQCRSFAFKAVNAGCLAYAGESHQEAIARVEKRLKDPNYFNRNRQTLERLGLIQGAQA